MYRLASGNSRIKVMFQNVLTSIHCLLPCFWALWWSQFKGCKREARAGKLLCCRLKSFGELRNGTTVNIILGRKGNSGVSWPEHWGLIVKKTTQKCHPVFQKLSWKRPQRECWFIQSGGRSQEPLEITHLLLLSLFLQHVEDGAGYWPDSPGHSKELRAGCTGSNGSKAGLCDKDLSLSKM